MGVEIVGSIEELLPRVDVVLLETNDGRPHFEQALLVFKAKKPCFIDKPLAGSLADCLAIFAAAKKYDTPVFTASSLRYVDGAQQLRRASSAKSSAATSTAPRTWNRRILICIGMAFTAWSRCTP